jgi:exopolyphosphatase / guanosine-5'-triphosphate,3'-diphosphate pyrophosphatase
VDGADTSPGLGGKTARFRTWQDARTGSVIAVIDIGTNTTRLLVAEVSGGRLEEVLHRRHFVAPIPGKERELSELVEAEAALARSRGAEEVIVVGTAAVRSLPAVRTLERACERAAGGLEILSERREAELAFLGATAGLVDADEPVAVVDVGGGSTELVVGTLATGVSWSASLRIGSGFLAEAYLRSDPPSAAELDKVRLHVAGVFEGLDAPRPPVAYAVGGSAGSLRRLVGGMLEQDSLGRGLNVLSTMSSADVARRFELDAERVRLLPAGMLVLEEASRLLGSPLRIGRGGLREGVILEELSRQEAA